MNICTNIREHGARLRKRVIDLSRLVTGCWLASDELLPSKLEIVVGLIGSDKYSRAHGDHPGTILREQRNGERASWHALA